MPLKPITYENLQETNNESVHFNSFIATKRYDYRHISHRTIFSKQRIPSKIWKNITLITKDNTANLHVYMMATHKKIQENTDFQYIYNAGQI